MVDQGIERSMACLLEAFSVDAASDIGQRSYKTHASSVCGHDGLCPRLQMDGLSRVSEEAKNERSCSLRVAFAALQETKPSVEILRMQVARWREVAYLLKREVGEPHPGGVHVSQAGVRVRNENDGVDCIEK